MSLKRNTLWNLAGSGLPLIAAAICIPYLLNGMGKETFGILTLIWALIGYFSLFDLGVGRSLTYEISKLLASNNTEDIRPTLKAGLIITTITGLVGGFILWLTAPKLAHDWLRISAVYQADSLTAFTVCALAIIPTTITSGLRGALEGANRFAASNASKMIIGFGMFVLPACSFYLYGASLTNIALSLLVLRIFVVILALAQSHQTFKQYISKITLTYTYFRRLFTYGFWITITGIISPLMVYGDRFLISNLLGADQLSYYSIPQEGLFRLLILPAALSGALMPAFTTLKGEDLLQTYKTNFKRVAYVMLAVCCLSAALAYPVMSWWLSPEFANKSIGVTLILCVGIWVNSVSITPFTLLQARGSPKVTAIFHLIELALYIPLVLLMVHNYGLLGAGFAWLFRVLIDFSLLYVAVKKNLRVNHVLF
jgi:O-antigen/teichoic acid export membrane protein